MLQDKLDTNTTLTEKKDDEFGHEYLIEWTVFSLSQGEKVLDLNTQYISKTSQ